MSAARKAAIDVIAAIDGGAQAQAAINRSASRLPPDARPFHVELVYGVLRARLRLRFVLGAVLARPEKLPQLMRIALEQAAYSLLFQSGAPAYAVINESVKIVKKAFGQKLANVANAALRSLGRMGAAPLERDWRGQTASMFYSLPDAIFGLWRGAYGEAAALALAKRSFARPHLGIRANLAHAQGGALRAALLAAGGEAAGQAGAAFAAGRAPRALLGKSLDQWQREGALSFQAAGSMAVLEQLGIFEAWQGAPIWDACAGRGGKTMALLERGLDVGLASDSSLARIDALPKECARLGLPAARVAAASAAAPLALSWSGHILADAPCSGLGVLGRRPDIKARWTEAGARQLADLQKAILANLADALKPGRELCYITCSLNPAENELQIQALLERRPDLELIKQWQTPHGHEWLEGMFGARLAKTA